MIAKSLDAYVLAKLLLEKQSRPYALIARELEMSASECHSAVHRLAAAGLVALETRRPRIKAVEDFLFSGVRYVFPAIPGSLRQGVATSYAASPLKDLISGDGNPVPVWPNAEGAVRGYAIEPLHPSAPMVAKRDSELYALLALIDAIREGRPRERALAEKELHQRIHAE